MKTVFVAIVIIQLLAVASVSAWAAFNSLDGSAGSPSTSNPGSDHSTYLTPANVGAPPGYGLTDPSRLQARGPILINGDIGLTQVNGVRSGTGTLASPYIISDWLIDGALYPNTDSMLTLRNTTKWVIVQNNKIVNLATGVQWEGIQLGQYPFIQVTKNVIIRHNEVQSRTAYGIALREGATNVRVESNLVTLDAYRNWTYGIMTDRNVHGITFYGNYINAYTSRTLLTVGLQVGDFWVVPGRPASDIVSERNTIVNATQQGMQSDDTRNYTIRYNLVYNDYPGRKTVPGWVQRGIMVEDRSNYTYVYGNVVYQVENAIEVAAGRGTYYSNIIHDSNYAIYINANNSFAGSQWTLYNTVYNTTYWNIARSAFNVPANGMHTVLDVGAGVTPTDFSMTFSVATQSPSQIGYSWTGSEFNVSMMFGTLRVYDRQTSTFNQNLQATWTGSALQLQVTRFNPTSVMFSLRSTTVVSFSGSQFQAGAYYQVLQGGILQTTVATSVTGGIAFVMTALVSSTFEVRYVQPIPGPTLRITAPSNNTYVTTASVQTTWIVNDTGPGIRSVIITLDGGVSVNVTSVTSYTMSALVDGRHVIQITATDLTGLTVSSSVVFFVDTQPPSIAIKNPASNATINTTSLLVTWNVTDAGSGVNHVEIQLDGGAAIAAKDNYTIGGLTQGSHGVSVTAVDNAGLSATAQVHFLVDTSILPGGGGNITNSTPAIAAIAYVPAASTVDIAFSQPMNQTSVASSLDVTPHVDHTLEWVSASHVRLVIKGSMAQGTMYQVTVGSAAKGSSGAALANPFLFQFLANSPPDTTASLSPNWIVIVLLIIVLLLTVNWTTAGFLVFHYRSDSKKVRSALGRLSKRYQGSLVIVYKRLARSPPHGKKSQPGAVAKAPVKMQRPEPDVPVIRYGKPRKSSRRR